jgi:hypothetical protein
LVLIGVNFEYFLHVPSKELSLEELSDPFIAATLHQFISFLVIVGFKKKNACTQNIKPVFLARANVLE